MAGIHHHVINLIKPVRREQADVVFERLSVITVWSIDHAMAENLANCLMMIDSVMQSIIVAISVAPKNAYDQNTPHIHTGSPVMKVDLFGKQTIQDPQDLFQQNWVEQNVL